MYDFLKTPPLSFGDENVIKTTLRNDIQAEGAAARRANLPVEKCPKFIDEDMAVNWRIGWRHEDEVMSGKRDRRTGIVQPD